MSDPVRSHRLQPTRLPHPWDSPGKNTGVGCHFLLQCMKVKSESEVAQSCPTLWTPWTAAHQATPCILAWDFPGKSTGVGCHCLLQCTKVKSENEVTQSCLTLRDPMDCSPPGSSVWDFTGKSTRVGCHGLLWSDYLDDCNHLPTGCPTHALICSVFHPTTLIILLEFLARYIIQCGT